MSKSVVYSDPVPEEIRIVIAEDSEAGRSQWLAIEGLMEDYLTQAQVVRSTALNAADLLLTLKRLERQGRRPDLIVLDLHLPLKSGPPKAPAMRIGVWIAMRIRESGNLTSRIVLWTNNVSANERNDAFAFCSLEVGGRPVGDIVLDKSEDIAQQAAALSTLIESARTSPPGIFPPRSAPQIDVGQALAETLPYLEAGLRPAEIARTEHLTKDAVDSRIKRLRDILCPDLVSDSQDRTTAIVTAAREAGIPWIPLKYRDPKNSPFDSPPTP